MTHCTGSQAHIMSRIACSTVDHLVPSQARPAKVQQTTQPLRRPSVSTRRPSSEAYATDPPPSHFRFFFMYMQNRSLNGETVPARHRGQNAKVRLDLAKFRRFMKAKTSPDSSEIFCEGATMACDAQTAYKGGLKCEAVGWCCERW